MLDRTEDGKTDAVTTPVDEGLDFDKQTHRRKDMKPRRKGDRMALQANFNGRNYRQVLEGAVGIAEKYQERMAQHGPVKVLMKDGKWLEKGERQDGSSTQDRSNG